MSKITLVTKRGTAIVRRDAKTEWAGKEFVEYQEKKMSSLPSKIGISKERGTTLIMASKYPRSIKRQFLGKIILSTARGTSRRLL